LAGFFSDRCTARGGRRKPFVIFGTLIGFVGLLVLWWAHRNMAIKVYFLVFFIAMLALNVIYVAYRYDDRQTATRNAS
jgi:Na+/melibiose symporter-like transporter